MVVAKEIREYMVSEVSRNIVVMSTSDILYFFRATVKEGGLNRPGYSYHLYSVDGSEVDITGFPLDIHPLLLEQSDVVRRPVFIGMPGSGIFTVHPDDVSVNDTWLIEQFFIHGIEEEDVNWNPLHPTS